METQKQNGFTLIEILIYVAIIGTAVTSLVFFAVSVSDSRNKNYVVQEVQANGRVAIDIISQRIRAATGVNIGSSIFDSDPGVLSLAMADGAKNPTIINLNQDDGVLQITEGLSEAAPVTSDKVKITNLIFTNLTPSGERENIKVEITLEYANAGDVEFAYSQEYRTAVSVRQ
jgi:prepilin-type N-terminal cleavage/methylation domain-containing protein